MKEELKKITGILLDQNASFLQIRDACESLYNFFVTLSSFETPLDNSFMPTRYGRALSPYVAALCIRDITRTRQTLRGVCRAIRDKLDQQRKPVKILYAGSGPFATLVFPLTSIFSPEEIQLQLLEIHPASVAVLHKVIKQLGIDDYIYNVETIDATSFEVPREFQPDMVVSETMNAALQWEPQVGIMAHLISQVPKETVMIPERITVDACLSTAVQIEGTALKPLGTLLEFNSETARKINSNPALIPVMNEGITINIPEADRKFNLLILLTLIKVYKDIEIGYNESGLTVPIQQMERDRKTGSFPPALLYKYYLGKHPEFVYERIKEKAAG
jgi:hypothetical protein